MMPNYFYQIENIYIYIYIYFCEPLKKMQATFLGELHLSFIQNLDNHQDEFEYWALDHLRMSAFYWAITALMLLKGDQWEQFSPVNKQSIIEFVLECHNEDGGFGGNINMPSHMLFTLSALQTLRMLNSINLIDSDQVVRYILSLQLADGSFQGDSYGEVDTRFTYCAVSSLHLLGCVDVLDDALTVDYISRCRNPDGGFGAIPGGESHAGQSISFSFPLCL